MSLLITWGDIVAGHGLYAWGGDIIQARASRGGGRMAARARAGDAVSAASRAAPAHVVLDTEGTTSPAAFVRERLYPYASARFAPWLAGHGTEEDMAGTGGHRAISSFGELGNSFGESRGEPRAGAGDS
jgi:hypothetical protein